tara:strand:- start:118 stop:1395 length:1278 start_codon:yes stop_codon:yes gene_type:complete
MATISIGDNDARIQHSIGSSGNTANVTTFTIDFPFFELDDIKVTITNSSGVDTALTRGTGSNTFAVTGTSVDDGFSGGNITLGSVYTSSTVTIFRDVPITRTSDFATSGPFNISSLNTDLDKIYAVMQQIETNSARSLKLPTTDSLTSITLPTNISRRGKYLVFNESTGDAEAGGSVADTGTVASISANITTVAGISANVTTVAGISSDVTTVASNNTNVTTVAGQVTNMTNITNNLSAVQNASANATKAENYAIKTNGAVESSNYSSKAWAIGGTGVTDTAGSGSAKEWATDTTNTCDGTEFSAKEYAIGTQSAQSNGSAKQWAIGGGSGFDTNTVVAGGLYSAKYYAELAAASVDSFDDTYLGAKSSDPSADNDGDALNSGDLYFNSTNNILRVYNGSSWQDAATDTSTLAGQGFAVAMAIAL